MLRKSDITAASLFPVSLLQGHIMGVEGEDRGSSGRRLGGSLGKVWGGFGEHTLGQDPVPLFFTQSFSFFSLDIHQCIYLNIRRSLPGA